MATLANMASIDHSASDAVSLLRAHVATESGVGNDAPGMPSGNGLSKTTDAAASIAVRSEPGERHETIAVVDAAAPVGSTTSATVDQGISKAAGDPARRRISLRMRTSSGALGREQHFATSTITIGRRPQNMIVLNDMTVSGLHAEIRLNDRGSAYELHDLTSSNGTFVAGRKVDSVELRSGDIIEIGIFRLEFRLNDGVPGAAEGALLQAELEYLSGAMSGIRQQLERSITRVSASGQVVVIAKRKTGWFVTHMEGLSRSLVNGKPLGGQAMPLQNFDVLELNSTRIRFRLL